MKDILLFKNVNIESYKNLFKIKNIKAESLVFSEGDTCESLGIVLSGEIKVSTLTALNKEYTINILNKGDLFGDVLLFSNNNSYLGDGIALKDSKILYISKLNLLTLLKNTKILENYLELISNKTSTINNRLKLLSQNSIEDRVLFFFYQTKVKNLIQILFLS